MTEQEYNEQLKQLDDEFQAAKNRYATAKKELAKEYVLSNNPYQVGDVVKDIDKQIIRITAISVGYSPLQNKYMCVYTGILLNKDLTPKSPQKTVETRYIKSKINTD